MKGPLLLIICLCYISFTGADECPQNDKFIVCYYGSWSNYRFEEGYYNLSYIDPTLCTHIVYTFAGLDIESKVTTLDYSLDITNNGYKDFIKLKDQNPCVKLLLAIGGWNEGSRKYSIMASTDESIHAFTENVLRFLVNYGFDGLDFDWEYPTSRGGHPDDKDNFSKLLKALYPRLSKWGLILSIAVPMSIGDVSKAYDVQVLSSYVDYVSIMAYDYTPTNSKVTGLLAPFSEIKKSIDYWISNNFPADKLVLGIPSYARTFTLKDASHNSIGAETKGPGAPGRFTREEGFLSYYELQLKLESGRYSEKIYDENMYAFYRSDWISYDTIDTYKTKIQYALSQNLKGIMLWTIDTDDFFGHSSEPYPILNTINSVIKENQ